jgi:pimeloyl-ACP methyl ester carboxylesterase
MGAGKKIALGIIAIPVIAIGGLALYKEPAPRPSGEWRRRAGVRPAFVQAGGLRVRYARRGSGPPVILVHGFGSSIYTWAEVIPILARDHDVIAVDLPGFGGSDVPGHFDREASAELLARVMDGLGVLRASFAGNSLGGALSAVTAARHPGRVDRLVLIDAAGYNLSPQDRPPMLRMMAAIPGRLQDLWPQRPVLRMGLKQVFYDDSRVTHDKVEEYLAPMARPGARKAARALLASGETFGLPGLLKGVRAPTLVIWGADDVWVPPADADRFVRDIPGARKVLIPQCGHVPQEEKPQEVAALIADFLRTN